MQKTEKNTVEVGKRRDEVAGGWGGGGEKSIHTAREMAIERRRTKAKRLTLTVLEHTPLSAPWHAFPFSSWLCRPYPGRCRRRRS